MYSYVLSYEFLLIIYKLRRRSGVLNEQVLCYDELRLCEWLFALLALVNGFPISCIRRDRSAKYLSFNRYVVVYRLPLVVFMAFALLQSTNYLS